MRALDLIKKNSLSAVLAFDWICGLEGFSWKIIPSTLKACTSNGPLFVTIGHCTWKTKYIFGSISAPFAGIFPKIHAFCQSRMLCKRCKFCCDRPLSKGILLVEYSTFSVVSQVSLKGFLLKFAPITFHYKRCKFACYWPIIKGSLFEEQINEPTPHACATNGAKLNVIGQFLRGGY